MKKLLSAVLVVVAAAGCGLDPADRFRDAVPSANQVKIEVPGKTGQALSGGSTRQDGLEGQIAGFYQVTRGVTVVVNGAALLVLGLVKGITDHQPTQLNGNTAVWGPHTDPLSPNTWRFTVNCQTQNECAYMLEGRGKNEPDSAFRAVLTGTHERTGNDLGKGSFVIDWDTAQTLPEHDANVGKAAYQYSHVSAASPVLVDATFTQVRDADTGNRVNATYKFSQEPNAGGRFEFTVIKNITGTPALEALTINSRWQHSGAGRADVRAVGGDLAQPATASECWDSNFLSRYLAVSFDPAQDYGQESACAFGTAQYPAATP